MRDNFDLFVFMVQQRVREDFDLSVFAARQWVREDFDLSFFAAQQWVWEEIFLLQEGLIFCYTEVRISANAVADLSEYLFTAFSKGIGE